jgi:hypothetical protein
MVISFIGQSCASQSVHVQHDTFDMRKQPVCLNRLQVKVRASRLVTSLPPRQWATTTRAAFQRQREAVPSLHYKRMTEWSDQQ